MKGTPDWNKVETARQKAKRIMEAVLRMPPPTSAEVMRQSNAAAQAAKARLGGNPKG